jgi:hypothetical protein
MEISMTIFYQSSRAVVEFILNTGRFEDMDEIIEDSFRLLWGGMAPEYFFYTYHK